ncbi:L-seryl-tRNA(Sec) selenium transferase [Kroppenstedtia guangzhouensis]|uniref:L-seryl-tRNA(Sec) selenium transferase n=1 Tax=Kroppenstedtia guangzhouensis TaxID=1274356 RepID=A0ABQ1G4E8_9BACL|nr:L-seryl-tRNA(Sec) selenium transferase [Kroppenstedtia guangzhouensis]GGA35672.1 L-seryl-tRNA(Sec) selenium transferase [Kroppenstedtia guangzhouensis]
MLTDPQREALRRLPAVHELLKRKELTPWLKRLPRGWVAQAVGEAIAMGRREILENPTAPHPSASELVARAVDSLHRLTEPRLRPVLNGSGVVLHTNLGRAVLSEAATEAIRQVARSASNLEFRLEEGGRGSRYDHVEELLCRLTGAEAAMVVNNNAAAVFHVLQALAKGKEVIVSRGQLVEIGGSFRVSEIMRESGGRLVEVGTTNKTRIQDYEQALTDETGMLMKVHTSNFRIIGFTEEASRQQLATLAWKWSIPFFEDLGSGILYDLKAHGIGDEPTVRECLEEGTDLLSFSGDKLLGGPQAGIIVGKKVWIDRLKKNQLTRSLRVDKFTLAALEATLRHYLNPEEAAQKIPTLRQILKEEGELKSAAEQLAGMIRETTGDVLRIETVPARSEVGGGSLPGVELPTHCVAITPQKMSLTQLEYRLRQAPVPVVGRVFQNRLFLDPRTLEVNDFPQVAASFRYALQM